MKAMVRFRDGSHKICTITNRETDGSGEYGYAIVSRKKRIPVSQSTTIHHTNGTIEKQWDEILQTEIVQAKEEEW